MKKDRLIRMMELRVDASQNEPNYMIKGYASTFEPYVLWRDYDGNDFYEVIDKDAFADADMSDVVLRIDHEGTVFARNKAGNLTLSVDDHGLAFEADLSKTENQRRLYEDIAAGMYPQASFAFTVTAEGDQYDKKTRTRTISKIEKLYDVSPVSFPANPGTEVDISTRAYLDGVIETEKAERLFQARSEENKARSEALKLKLLKERLKK